MPVVPQSPSFTPVTADTGRRPSSYDLNAAFTSFQPLDSRSSRMKVASMSYGLEPE